jgi:hypothetical protein
MLPVVVTSMAFYNVFGCVTDMNTNVMGIGFAIGAVDIFKTRTMMKALEQMLPLKTWLRDTVFPSAETHTSRYVDIDIIKGSRRIAAYVHPMHEGKVVDREGFKTFTVQAPYTKEKMVTTAQDFFNRAAGETIYDFDDTPASRAQKQLGKDLKTLNERVERLEEVQAAQAIQEGKVTCKGDGIELEVDFLMPATHKPVLTGTNKWSDHTNSKPLDDLSVWSMLVQKDSGLVPGKCIMGVDAISDFVSNASVKAVLDNRRLILGAIEPSKLNDQGVQFWGDVRHAGLSIEIYSYVEWYYDYISKIEKPLIDPNKVCLLSTAAKTTRHYGAIQDIKAGGNFVTPRFAKSWETDDPSARWIMVQSAPLCAPHQIDGFLCGTVR